MTDLTVDVSDLNGAQTTIAGIASSVLDIAAQAEQAMADAAGAVSDPSMRASLHEAYFQARTSYQTLADGLFALGRFAGASATTFEQSDHALADTLSEVTL